MTSPFPGRRNGGGWWLGRIVPIVILSLMVAGCGRPQPPLAMPQPFPASTLFREELACGPMINAAMVDLMDVLRKEFGQIAIERYSIPLAAGPTDVTGYYRGQLPTEWQAGGYPADHATYHLAVWSSGGWTKRSLAVALLNERGCPEHLPYRILLVAVPSGE